MPSASNYTPSLDEVRKAWSAYRHDPFWHGREFFGVNVNPEFDRMISQVRAEAYKDAEDAAADALRTWWLRETLPEDDTDSVMDVRRAIRAARVKKEAGA